jgi:hypothetical protein
LGGIGVSIRGARFHNFLGFLGNPFYLFFDGSKDQVNCQTDSKITTKNPHQAKEIYQTRLIYNLF